MAKPAKATHFQKPHTRVSVLHRSSNFHTKITGYRSGKEPWLNQVHHVLPCCLFKAAYILSAINNDALKAKYINDCLWVTKWDINLGNNLKQLPL